MSDQYTHIELERRIDELERENNQLKTRILELEGGQEEMQATIRARNEQLAECVPWNVLIRACQHQTLFHECKKGGGACDSTNRQNCPLLIPDSDVPF
jgi:hypothetical protein